MASDILKKLGMMGTVMTIRKGYINHIRICFVGCSPIKINKLHLAVEPPKDIRKTNPV